jgi:hypothetical protein
MLRQNNEATSPFVFVYVQNSKVLVDYLDAATNQVVTLEGGLLSAATEARFLKIERKEGSVYVFESGDSLTWKQITVVSLLLTSPVQIGLVSDVTNGLAQVQFDSVLVQAQSEDGIAFTIDTAEVAGATQIWADIFGPYTNLNASSGVYKVDLPTEENPIKLVTLSSKDDDIVATDVLIYGFKDTLTFNAANSARAEIVNGLVNMWDVEPSQIASIYPAIKQHPLFKDLVDVYLVERGWPNDEALRDKLSELEVKIIIDIRTKVKSESSSSRPFTAQIVTPFQPVGSTFELKQGADPRDVTVHADSFLNFRVLVFNGDDVKNVTIDLDFLKNNVKKALFEGYLEVPETDLGFRDFFADTNISLSPMNLPSDDCNAYAIVASAFIRGPSGEVLDPINNPQYANYVALLNKILSAAGYYASPEELVQAWEFLFTSSENFITKFQEFNNALENGNTGEAARIAFDMAYEYAIALYEVRYGESPNPSMVWNL